MARTHRQTPGTHSRCTESEALGFGWEMHTFNTQPRCTLSFCTEQIFISFLRVPDAPQGPEDKRVKRANSTQHGAGSLKDSLEDS